MSAPEVEFQAGKTCVRIVDTEAELGLRTAEQAAAALQNATSAGRDCVLWTMAAPSAFSFYSAFISLAQRDANLAKILARTHFFQFDDYPLARSSPRFKASFRHLLEARFYSLLKDACRALGPVHALELCGDPADESVALSYARSLLDLKTKGAFILQIKGNGMDGHWGFHGAETPLQGEAGMITVPMNQANRHQQMLDWPLLFKNPADVPELAYTFNVPMFLKADEIIDNVPQASKEYAALATYGTEEILNELPSSALKAHACSSAYLTRAAARSLLDFRAARSLDPLARLGPETRQRLGALWQDPQDPAKALANCQSMEAALKKLGML